MIFLSGIHKKNIFLTLCILFTGCISVFTQALHQITHFRGTKNVGGVQVTVNEQGFVDSLYYCGDDTGPYFVGNDYSKYCCSTGSYIFNFSTPVKWVSLNIAAVSTSEYYDEEMEIFVNGAHYTVTNTGDTNGCEPKLIISEQGNLRPCDGCYGSGADHIKIDGPVKNIRVTCKINFGQPQGAVFGIYFEGDPVPSKYATLVLEVDKIAETGARKEFIISSPKIPGGTYTLKNEAGKKIPVQGTINEGKLIIDASGLAKGMYTLDIELNKQTETLQLIVR